MNAFFLLGALSLVAGGLLIYLASPNQLWRAKPLPPWPGRLFGWGCLVLSLVLLAQAMLTLTATFVFVIGLTVVWVALPYIGTRFKRRQHLQKV